MFMETANFKKYFSKFSVSKNLHILIISLSFSFKNSRVQSFPVPYYKGRSTMQAMANKLGVLRYAKDLIKNVTHTYKSSSLDFWAFQSELQSSNII